ncbi:MAG: hypothetical protein ACD_45C00658G0009 [uncultured bacterium]|nr:MAG: hypothetical protein ACD_45C00658G0009 [uncultured bacterium]
MNANHLHYMSLALRLAEQGRLTVSPNPMVGCIIVKNNHIVGQGFHQRAGEPHAEIFALREAREQAKGASAYITLEPCCHQGKTPPCTSALIAAGIKNVYVSCMDPNPLVSGKGITLLRSAGIAVEVGFMSAEATQLNEIFFHYIKNKRPFVIAKWAMSLDGKKKVNPHDDKQISCRESQYHTHQVRQQVDAILVGANTIHQDNPQLTVRFASSDKAHSKQPIRIILSGQKKLPLNLNIFNDKTPGRTIIVATKKTIDLVKHIKSNHVELCILPENKEKKICLPTLLDKLGQKEITSLLVEGGATVHESFFKENLVNKVHIYLSSTIIGSLDKKKHLSIKDFSKIGSDFHFIADFQEIKHV